MSPTLINVSEREMDATVERHYASLYRYALGLSANPSTASDLTQETFYLWVRHREEILDPDKVRSWLFTTLYRLFLKLCRHSTRFPHSEIDAVEDELPTIAPETISGLDGGLVMDALLKVDERYRLVLVQFYMEGLTYSEIAAAADIPIGTVMSRISRGRAELREHLTSSFQTEAGKVIPFRTANGTFI